MKISILNFVLLQLFFITVTSKYKINLKKQTSFFWHLNTAEKGLQQWQSDQGLRLLEKQQLKVLNGVYHNIDIQIGQEMQLFTLQFRLNRNNFWVPNNWCDSCSIFKTFNDEKQTRYKCKPATCSNMEQTQTFSLKNCIFSGYQAQDQVTFGQDLSGSLQFISVFSMKNQETRYDCYERLDGELQFGVERNGSIVNELFLQRKIERNLFSLTINAIPAGFFQNRVNLVVPDSELIIGGYNEEIVQDPSKIPYFKVNTKNRWSIQFKNVAIDNKVVASKKRNAIINIDFDVFYIPSEDYQKFKKSISSIISRCDQLDRSILCRNCNESFINEHPPLKIKLVDNNSKTHVFYVPPQDFISNYMGNCLYKIFQHPEFREYQEQMQVSRDDWLIGDLFLKQAHSIFNYENESIGLINLNKFGGEIEIEEEETEQHSYHFAYSLIFIASSLLLIYICIKMNFSQNNQSSSTLQQELVNQTQI